MEGNEKKHKLKNKGGGKVLFKVERKKKAGEVRRKEVQNEVDMESERMRREGNHIHKSIRHLFIIPGRAPM